MTQSAKKQDLHFLHQLDLPTATVNHLLENIRLMYVKRGERIIRQGETCRDIHLIVNGIVRAYKDDDKSDNVCAFYREKDFFTSLNSFIHGTVAETNIEAIENCELYVLSWEKFNAIREVHPELMTQTLRILSDRLVELLKEKDRLLTLTATQRYLYFLEKYPDLVHRIPLGHISSYLGMRQSSLSRVRRDIHRQFTS